MNTPAPITCYGCGAPEVFRSNCSTCSKLAKPIGENAAFYSINAQLGRNIPTAEVKIFGQFGIAHIDTAARTSVASASLYKRLLQQNCQFKPVIANITLADGSTKNQKVLTTTIPIELGKKVKKIQMLVLPEATDNKTLLGIDFLETAAIMLNIPQSLVFC